MYFMQLDDMLDLVKREQAELHRQAARTRLPPWRPSTPATRRAGGGGRA